VRPPRFVIITGPTNAGKTTTTRALSAVGYVPVFFDTHYYRVRGASEWHGVRPATIHRAAREVIFSALDAWRGGADVAVEGGAFMLRRVWMWVAGELTSRGVDACYVLLDAPLHVLRRRLAGRLRLKRRVSRLMLVGKTALLLGTYWYWRWHRRTMPSRLASHPSISVLGIGNARLAPRDVAGRIDAFVGGRVGP